MEEAMSLGLGKLELE